MTSDFTTSLLRERFVIHDVHAPDGEAPLVALSNRIAVPLGAPGDERAEYFVVRAQNMHSCTRLAARLAQDYQENGPLMTRAKPFDWNAAWNALVKGYEKTWNPQRWAAVYYKGRVVFESGDSDGTRHPFVDIVEQCEAVNTDSYEKSLRIAEDAFQQAGKPVSIAYDSNVALIMSVKDDEGKCGVILRGPARTTTFNFIARPRGGRNVRPSQCLSAAAAFLEGIQLSFLIGMANIKQRYDLIDKHSPEAKQSRDAAQKIGRLNEALEQFANLLEITYRPDRPDFGAMIDEAEAAAHKILAAHIEEQIKSGEANGTGWVR